MDNCQICDGLNKKQMNDVYKCTVCNHIFRDYKSDGIAYHQNQFRSTDKDIKDNKVTKGFHNFRHKLVVGREKLISKYLNNNQHLLDIGGGAGTFANYIKGHVASVECTELDPKLIAECRRLGFTTYDQDMLKIDFKKKYDVVTMWHVVEHIKDLNQYLEKIKTLTKDLLIIEIPTLKSPLTNKVRRMKSPNPIFDGHYHYFSMDSLKKLYEKDYDILEISEDGIQKPCIFMVMRVKN